MKAKIHASEENRTKNRGDDWEGEREFWRDVSFGCSYKGWGERVCRGGQAGCQ